jgi:eukaryotic-like serine/threonine-protein kinase
LSLTPGTRLGAYEILAPLGAGGMGEVYRARDPKLGREIAIKVLPTEISDDAGRRQRFEQEARSASALNHPGIITIYDIGSDGGVTYIAMELVEGRTLRDVLAEGPLSTKKILEIGAQAADGLAKAHAAGIVHRDLKPENLMISKDGFAKILDFGLAKLTSERPLDAAGREQAAASEHPMARHNETAISTLLGTEPGTVMGTAGYMSPEQAGGQPLDFRSDQFTLGAILYEMATGERAFRRKTGAETLVAIIREDPAPIGQLSPKTPAPLRWIIERCLAKDPDERYASTRDLARELKTVQDHLSEASVSGEAAAAISGPRRSRPAVFLLLAAAGISAAVFGAFLLGKEAGKSPPPIYSRLTFRAGLVNAARFAPDGQTILYDAAWEKNPLEIFSSRLDSPDARPLGLGAALFSVSSSGEMAVAAAPRRLPVGIAGTLARVSAAGSAPREILQDVTSADWSADGKALAIVRDVAGTSRLEFPPGTLLFETKGQISDPRVSPRGDSVAFIEHPVLNDSAGFVAMVDRSGRKKALTRSWGDLGGLAWGSGGKEIWFTAATIGSARDLKGVTPEGKTREISRVPGGMNLHDVSRDGKVLVDHRANYAGILGRIAGESQERALSWLDYSFLRDLSSDGSTLLFDEEGEGGGLAYSVYVRKIDGSAAIRLGDGVAQALSPDGKWALTMTLTPSKLHLQPTGPGDAKDLTQPGLTYQYGATFLPDGRIVFRASETGHGPRYFVQDLNGGKPRPITPEGAVGYAIATPDGRFIETLDANRHHALFPIDGGPVRPFEGLEVNDRPLRWSPDGKTLYVRNGALPARLYRMDTSSKKRELWRELMPSDPAGVVAIRTVKVSADGASVFYGYTRHLSNLYLLEGLR